MRPAREWAAALVVGAVLAAVYGAIALRGRYVEPLLAGLGVGAHAAPTAAPAEAHPTAEAREVVEAIEGVLDAYAAHRVEREQAAERIPEPTRTM